MSNHPKSAMKPDQRVPQLRDTVHLTLELGPVEEWAADLLSDYECVHHEEHLTVKTSIGGNCNAVSNAANFLRDVEEALAEGEINPMEFCLTSFSTPPPRAA